MANDRQVQSIKKLCLALRQDEPDFANLTFAEARELLTEFSRLFCDLAEE